MASRYETTVTVERFTGIDESAGAHNGSLSIAAEAQNCLTEQGLLRPATGYAPVYPPLAEPIVTLATFYRRNHEVEAERRVLVASTATALYAITEGASAWKPLMSELTGGGRWSWVTYEQTGDGADPEDVLILSNASDGMVIVKGATLTAEHKVINLTSLDEHGDPVYTPIKFGIIERHAERIWGAEVPGEPDSLYYSQPFNPFNFNQVYVTEDGLGTSEIPTGGEVLPEQSGGVIQVPTWDGDRFVALKRFSNYILAYKRDSVFYVKGMSAGEFGQREAYGSDGAFAPRTVVTDGPTAYYVSNRGLGVFDGDTARLLDLDRLGSVFRNLGTATERLACAATARHVLYLSLPVYTGETFDEVRGGLTITRAVEPTRNNTMVEYDIRRRTYMVRTGIAADALLGHGGRLLFTSGDDPSQVYELTGTTYNGAPIPVRWATPWQDLGRKDVKKSAFELYVTGFECLGKQKVNIGIETEKRVKFKPVMVSGKLKRARFVVGNSGRRFRFVVEAQSTVDWSLSGGVQIKMELDED